MLSLILQYLNGWTEASQHFEAKVRFNQCLSTEPIGLMYQLLPINSNQQYDH